MNKRVLYSVLFILIASVLAHSIFSFVAERYPKIAGIAEDGEYDAWYGEGFYGLVPELVSHGDLFDFKLLLCDANAVNFIRESTESDENIGCLISVIKKSRGNFTYDVEITTYKDGMMVDVRTAKKLSYQTDYLMNLFSAIAISYQEGLPLGYVAKTNSLIETKQYDRIQFVFTYYCGGKKVEEVHNLVYNRELNNRLFYEIIEEYCSKVEENISKSYFMRLYVGKYMMSICNNDFEMWKDTIDLIISEAKQNDNSSWQRVFLSKFFDYLFPEHGIVLEVENLKVYENTRNEILQIILQN